MKLQQERDSSENTAEPQSGNATKAKQFFSTNVEATSRSSNPQIGTPCNEYLETLKKQLQEEHNTIYRLMDIYEKGMKLQQERDSSENTAEPQSGNATKAKQFFSTNVEATSRSSNPQIGTPCNEYLETLKKQLQEEHNTIYRLMDIYEKGMKLQQERDSSENTAEPQSGNATKAKQFFSTNVEATSRSSNPQIGTPCNEYLETLKKQLQEEHNTIYRLMDIYEKGMKLQQERDSSENTAEPQSGNATKAKQFFSTNVEATSRSSNPQIGTPCNEYLETLKKQLQEEHNTIYRLMDIYEKGMKLQQERDSSENTAEPQSGNATKAKQFFSANVEATSRSSNPQIGTPCNEYLETLKKQLQEAHNTIYRLMDICESCASSSNQASSPVMKEKATQCSEDNPELAVNHSFVGAPSVMEEKPTQCSEDNSELAVKQCGHETKAADTKIAVRVKEPEKQNQEHCSVEGACHSENTIPLHTGSEESKWLIDLFGNT